LSCRFFSRFSEFGVLERHPVKRFERPADKQSWARLEQHKFGELL
jgi:hypothetical protein